jgi:hypothetical protein
MPQAARMNAAPERSNRAWKGAVANAKSRFTMEFPIW